jgi:hypothetical protein
MMDRTTLILLSAAVIPGLALTGGPLPSHDPGRDPGTPPAIAITAEDTPYGCKVNVTATNSGSQRTAISRDSQVRSFAGVLAGPWKKLDKSIWISPGQTARWYYDLTFSCSDGRSYRFLVKQFDKDDRLLGEVWYAYPEVEGRTKSTSLDLGNLNRFF